MKQIIKIPFAFCILILVIASLPACKGLLSQKKSKPVWLEQRPVNSKYYIGVGYANKLNNPNDYQQLAKKNALNDLVGEIKVNVSTHSILSTFENNSNINQQYLTSTKITADALVEDFQVADSWEDKNGFWIYYKLSKMDYESNRRKKIQNAIDRSVDLLDRSNRVDLKDKYIMAIQFKVKALLELQNYYNEALEAFYRGRQVYLVNEIVNQLQDLLSKVSVRSEIIQLKGKVGKAIPEPFNVMAYLKDSTSFRLGIGGMAMSMNVEQGKMNFGTSTETDQNGFASFSVARILTKDPVQVLRISLDVANVVKGDSLNIASKNILHSLTVPSASIRVIVEPIKVFMQSNESNLSKDLSYNVLEPAIKKRLVEEGCNFVKKESEADYKIIINSETKDLGIMWGKMLQSSFDMNISLRDVKNDIEIYKDALQAVRGYQDSPDKAGLDAYKNGLEQFWRKIYTNLIDELLVKEH
jgi:hypothetical protein